MAIILNLESSSEVCSICISDGEDLLSIVETKEQFSHTRKMTLFIQQSLQESGIDISDLDAVAVSHGPGSYTGLRVSAATAKGLCYGLDIPLISVDTLAAIAFEGKALTEADYYIPMIDARRMEVYTSIYSRDLSIFRETHNLILEKDVFSEFEGARVALCGTGVSKSQHLFETNDFEFLPFDLSSRFLVMHAHRKYEGSNFADIVSYGPYYFKAPKVTKSKKPLF